MSLCDEQRAKRHLAGAPQAGMTADKKTKTQMMSVIPNTACALSAVFRFHMTLSRVRIIFVSM